MTARNAGKEELALKHGHERTQMLITYRQTNVDERADDRKSMLPVLIRHARRDLQHGGSKKSALAKELCASLLLKPTWTRWDLEANAE